MSATVKSFWCALVLGAMTLLARGDVLVGTNGERFVGTVIVETSTNVVFESELAGRLTFPQSKIRDLLRATAVEVTNAAIASVATNTPTNTVSWKPPGVGHDGSDWVQLKSGEWLRGQLKYVQNKEVEFDSDELDQQTLKLKDVSKLYSAHRMFTQFEDQKPAYGRVVISNDLVMVTGAEPLSLHRDLLMGITPSGGKTGINNWSGNFNLALSLQSGNNDQTTVSTSAELARRTPNTTLLFDYLGNYSQVDNVQSANNERVNVTYDIRLNQDWFVRPVLLEYYQDSLANIAYRLTAGVGGGYYIFDRDELKWTVFAGPAYQYTKFSTVETNQADSASTPAAVLGSNFNADLTQRLTFIQSLQSIFTEKEAGQYTHHSVSTLEFEIKRHLNLDVSFIWDYLQNPQAKSDGDVPRNSDYYLTVGFGVRF
ncbi:MAG: DUF481 domain-containing protein [Verrucomicrobiales bacterium]|nr:DUF481 domain-containing protein [Verrucomicrobiales bacterium]